MRSTGILNSGRLRSNREPVPDKTKGAGLYRAGPPRGPFRTRVGARIQTSLLHGIREATPRDLGADRVPDLLLLDVFRTLADVQFHLVTFVVFHGIGIAIDLLDRSTDGLPGRAWL